MLFAKVHNLWLRGPSVTNTMNVPIKGEMQLDFYSKSRLIIPNYSNW